MTFGPYVTLDANETFFNHETRNQFLSKFLLSIMVGVVLTNLAYLIQKDLKLRYQDERIQSGVEFPPRFYIRDAPVSRDWWKCTVDKEGKMTAQIAPNLFKKKEPQPKGGNPPIFVFGKEDAPKTPPKEVPTFLFGSTPVVEQEDKGEEDEDTF